MKTTDKSLPIDEAASLALKLKGALRLALDIMVYSPEYMHGMPTKTYKKRVYKALESLEKQYPKLNKFEVMPVGEFMERYKDNFYDL